MENFPNEILEKVFKHLRQKDLISITRVCHRFNSVIQEFGLIKKVYISTSTKEFDDSWIPARKYVEAAVVKCMSRAGLKVFAALGDQLTTLNLFRCFFNLADIVIILRATPNVKFLTFDNTKINFRGHLSSTESLTDAVELPRLQNISLVFNESHSQIFRTLHHCSIVKARLSSNQGVITRSYSKNYLNYSEFERLLTSQTALTSLTLDGFNKTKLFRYPMANPKYHLKEFAINYCQPEGLDDYLMNHVGTIETFKVQNVAWDPSSILNKCKKLRSIECRNVTMSSLEVLATVEELSFEPPTASIDCFPNVKKLKLSAALPETLETISRSMGKLEDMTIDHVRIAGLHTPNLRKLKLSSLEEIDGNFFPLHINIKELIIQDVPIINDSLLVTITSNLLDLAVFKLFGDNHLTSRAFKIIRDNCKSLKVFEMSKWNQKFSKDDWKILFDINGLQVYNDQKNMSDKAQVVFVQDSPIQEPVRRSTRATKGQLPKRYRDYEMC